VIAFILTSGFQLYRRAADAAGDAHLVHAERRAESRAHDLERMRADGNRDRAGAAGLVRALREETHVVRRHDVDAGQVSFLDHEAVHAGVDAVLRVFRDHHAGGDHRAAVVNRGHRDRQAVEVHLFVDLDHFLGRGVLDVFRRDRAVDALLEPELDLGKFAAAQRNGGAPARADDPRHDRHVVADDVVEIERLVGLVDQRRDVTDVHRLTDVGELFLLAQPVQEPAEIFLLKHNFLYE
jgi:hypothetical protein